MKYKCDKFDKFSSRFLNCVRCSYRHVCEDGIVEVSDKQFKELKK